MILAGCGAGGGTQESVTPPDPTQPPSPNPDPGQPEASELVVTGSDMTVSGEQSSNFTGHQATFELECQGETSIEWFASCDQPWVHLHAFTGTLEPTQTAQVVIQLTSTVSSFVPGVYQSVLTFVNLADVEQTVTHEITVTVTTPGSLEMTTASRTSGVAPLSVVFDPIGDLSVVQPSGAQPDHAEFTYAWNYGDAASGAWQHIGKSKNTSNAWIGCHVFEDPGTYRVTLQVTDAGGTVHDYHEDITVLDPADVFAGRTVFVAANGNDGNPGTQAQPFRTVNQGLVAASSLIGARRVLLRRGDTFDTGSSLVVNGGGPVLIGAYGSGSRPHIRFTGSTGGFSLSGAQDARLEQLTMEVSSATMFAFTPGVNCGHHTTVSRCEIEGFYMGVNVDSVNFVTIYETDLLNNQDYGMYAYGPTDSSCSHVAIMGNRFDGTNQHLLRTYMSYSLIQANSFEDANVSAMKLVGRPLPHPSHHVCVVDNRVTTEVIADAVGIGPENSTSDQHATDYQVDGNLFRSRVSGNNCLQLRGYRMVARNNVFDVDDRRGIRVEGWGVGPTPHSIRVENNTLYSVSGWQGRLLWAATSDSTIAQNNIIWCPGGSAETPAGSVTSTNNLMTNPQFVDAPNGNFSLSPSSPGVDAGVPSRVTVDFWGNSRSAGSAPDIGAIERQ